MNGLKEISDAFAAFPLAYKTEMGVSLFSALLPLLFAEKVSPTRACLWISITAAWMSSTSIISDNFTNSGGNLPRAILMSFLFPPTTFIMAVALAYSIFSNKILKFTFAIIPIILVHYFILIISIE